MAYSVGFREAVAYSLSCLNQRNQTSIRNGFQKEITVTPGILGQTSACALGPWQCLPGPVFPPVTLIKQGLGTRLGASARLQNIFYHKEMVWYEVLKIGR